MVHFEDHTHSVLAKTTKALPANAARLHNIIHVANHLMSHILHFYHLVALDYVKPCVWTGAAFAQLTRPFLAPRYDDNHYINTQRILAVAGLPGFPLAAVATLGTLNGWGTNPGDAVNAYLTGQYLKALNIRRICHELQAIFAGRAPMNSGYTPGAATCTYKHSDIVKAQGLLAQIKAFVGEPLDFANGFAGTMMFDVVAAAHLFPEYFWIGNSYNQFMAWGWGEEAGVIPLTEAYPGNFWTLFGNMPNQSVPFDNRASARGYKMSAQAGAPWNPVNVMKIGESIAHSRYNKVGVNYPNGKPFLHPWSGKTQPNTNQAYSWLKSPRYDIGVGNYQVFEVGPLARMVVAGAYWAGILSAAGYGMTPAFGAAGPDCAGATNALGAALKPVYQLIPALGGGFMAGGPNLSGVNYNGDSALDRIAARAIETRLMVDMAAHFLTQLDSTTYDSGGWSETGATAPVVPIKTAIKKGYGMSEASRGALSHWIKMKNGKITLYQSVVPTTWNASPKDANGNPGPAEQSLMSNGGAWVANPLEAIELPRITHSYDFCIACAVHLITPKGEKIKVDIPPLPG